MTQARWSAVDDYAAGLLAPHDPTLEAALSASENAGLPAIQVSPPQGKLLYLLARAIGAKTILEFGTLGAYSTIWLGRALTGGGRLVTLEADPDYAEVARENIALANLGDLVDLSDLHLTYCLDWTPKGSAPLTSLSSTRTRRTARAISPGPWIAPGREA